MIYDVLIVGSGASAVNAACPLIEAGLSVGMLDFGNQDLVYSNLVPDAPFMEIRKTDPHQHRYFLGNRFEGIPCGMVRVGPQLTPPRQYITKDAPELTPVDSNTLAPFATLALGGMASGWGAGAFPFSESDLRDFPISLDDLAPHYEKVAERIGISGEMDDLAPFDGELKAMLPPLRIDRNAATILERYHRHRKKLNAAGFYMGKTRLAALSQPYRGRGPDRYLDMSFWDDADQSVWRPHYTLKELQSSTNFSYYPSLLVQYFKERDDGTIEVISKNRDTGQPDSYRAKKLILASGVLGTARIVLRSLNRYEARVPFVCNPYTYYPMINLNMLGAPFSRETCSLAQLCVVYMPDAPGQPAVHGRVHSYRSLLSFKVIKEMPLPYREAMRVMKMIVSSLAILALDHEDRPSPDKFCVLHPGKPGGPDRLEVSYALSDEIREQQLRYEKIVVRHFRGLGCLALKRVWPGYGASLHYGGTFPMSRDEKKLTVDIYGRLRETRSVYIVDGSVFPYLSSKGLTFTMMANANRIAEHLAKEFQ